VLLKRNLNRFYDDTVISILSRRLKIYVVWPSLLSSSMSPKYL